MKNTKTTLAAKIILPALSLQMGHAETMITDVQSGIGGQTIPEVPISTDSGSTIAGNSGSWDQATDGNSATFYETFSPGGNVGDYGYLGIRFNSAQNNVNRIEIDFRVFVDGGWFNGGEGVEPTVQVTTADISGWNHATAVLSDTDDIWTTVPSTTDYITGLNVGTSGDLATAGMVDGDTFAWDFAPQDGITAVRVIGDAGGSAGAIGGFLGAREIRAFAVPEPSSIALEVTDISYSPPPAGNGNGSVSMTWNSLAGKSYSIYRSSDLTPSSWVIVDDAVPSEGVSTSFTFQNPSPGTETQFFRISQN